jgi:hypothetical protein
MYPLIPCSLWQMVKKLESTIKYKLEKLGLDTGDRPIEIKVGHIRALINSCLTAKRQVRFPFAESSGYVPGSGPICLTYRFLKEKKLINLYPKKYRTNNNS